MSKTTTPREDGMALVRMTRGGQLTLPIAARRALKLNEGDYLEAEVTAGGVMLKPVAVIDRQAAWEDLTAILSRKKWTGPGPEPSEDEVLDTAADEI